MGSHRLNRKVSLAAALTVFSLGFAHYAGAVTRPVVPDTTTEWGNEVVRVTDDGGGSMTVGSAGASMDAGSSGSEAAARRRAAGLKPADTAPTVDYCIDLTLTNHSSGPYRVRFHFDADGGDTMAAKLRSAASRSALGRRRVSPLDSGAISVSFTLDTSADGAATTAGDSGLVGTLYDNTDTLVAADDGLGGHISTSLAAGTYTLVIEGGDSFVGTYSAMADQGTCGN